MDIRNIYNNGNYLRAHDLKGKPFTLTIASCEIRNMAANGRSEDLKAVLRFNETQKEFACNKTNVNKISEAFGWESDNWGGKGNKVTLAPSVTSYNGSEVPCIRVTHTEAGTSQPSNGEVSSDELPGAELAHAVGAEDSPVPF
tara:strand:+ start:30103 stop:30531 length:429 start_codon:yes stop_codon:yes gene_type:complete